MRDFTTLTVLCSMRTGAFFGFDSRKREVDPMRDDCIHSADAFEERVEKYCYDGCCCQSLRQLLIMQSVGAWQEETKVPIALVVEEKSEMSARLVEDIASTELAPRSISCRWMKRCINSNSTSSIAFSLFVKAMRTIF